MAEPSSEAQGPFLVETYEDWSDYPGWVEWDDSDDDSEGSPRFSTVAEASAWIDAMCAQDIAERLANWQKAKALQDAQKALHDARMAVLIEAGLGPQREGESVVSRPHGLYPKPVADRSKYRVAMDGAVCPTCGVRGDGNKPKGDQRG